MGWGFNYQDTLYNPVSQNPDGTFSDGIHLDAATANETVSKAILKSRPFYVKKIPENVTTSLFDEEMTFNLQLDFGRDRLLSKAIPALTLPAGGKNGGDVVFTGLMDQEHVVDMNDSSSRNNWPSSRMNSSDLAWRHSDIKDVAYLYTFKIFNLINR